MTGPALTPIAAPLPASPTPAPPTKTRHASPFYLRYLNDQAAAIRAQGGDDTAVNHFLDMEEGKPFSGQVTGPTLDDVLGPDTPSNLRGISMAMLQGATFGFGDEALGALYGAVTGLGARAGIDQYRAEYAAWAKEHGKTALGAEIVGGILPTVLTLGSSAGAQAAARTTAGFLKSSAAAGAAYGAGNATGDISERTWGALTGGAAGFVGGAVLGGVGKFIVAPAVERIAASDVGKAVISPVERAIERTTGRAFLTLTPEARARERVAQQLLSENIDLTTLEQRLADLHRAGVPATILDAGGDNVLSLARGILADRSPLTTRIIEELQSRQGEQATRLPAALLGLAARRSNRFGLANAHEVMDALHAEGMTTSEPFYRDAFEQVIDVTPRLRRLLQHPEIKRAWDEGMRIARSQDLAGTGHGLSVKPLPDAVNSIMRKAGIPEHIITRTEGASKEATQLSVRGVDYMKRGLRLVINKGMKEGTLDAEGAKALISIRDEIVSEASTQVPAYGKALAAYGGPVTSRDAVRTGMKFLRMQPDEIKKRMLKLAPGDRDFARLGYVQSVYEKLLTGSDDVARGFFGGNLLGKPSLRMEQIRAIFPDAPEAAEAFARTLAGESRLSYTTQRVVKLPGTLTVDKLEQADVGNLPQVRGTAVTTAASALRQGLQRFRSKASRDEADELTHLFSKGLRRDAGDTGVIPRELRVLLDELQYSYGGLTAQRVVRKVAGKAVGQATQR